MRVLHFADLHLGVERYGQPVEGRPWLTHTQDILDALDRLVEYSLSEGVDLVVFAGDAFHVREPSPTHQAEFARRIRRLSDAGIHTFLLPGNHDLPNAAGRAHSLELYRMLDVANVTVGDNEWFREQVRRKGHLDVHNITTRAGRIQVAAVPWPQRSNLLAKSPDVQELPIEQETRQVERGVIELIETQERMLDPDVPALLVGHITVQHKLVSDPSSTEKWMNTGKTPSIAPGPFNSNAFDYVALGHHHNQVDLELDVPGWYAGSLQAIDFGDEKLQKGFVVFDIDPTKPRGARTGGSGAPQAVTIDGRRFLTLRLAPHESDPTAEICQAIADAGVDDAVIRLQIAVSQEQLQEVRRATVEAALEKAHHVAKLHYMTDEARRLMLPPGQEATPDSPLELLDLYLRNTKNMEPARLNQLITVGEQVVQSVDQRDAS